MDPRFIMAAIGENRKVMQAQLERLQAFTPAGMKNLPEDFSIGDLMGSAVTAHLQGAVDALRVINDAGTTARSSMPIKHETDDVVPEEEIIEAEFKEIK
jgi:hypothetical protein